MKTKSFISFIVLALFFISEAKSQNLFNGLNTNLNNLYRLSDAKTRSISPENPTGGKGKGGMATLKEGVTGDIARDLGQGWKVNPFTIIEPGQIDTLASINGSGAIKQIWMTTTDPWRDQILRIYWDGEEEPSVEVPVGDFFGVGWNEFQQISSLPITVNPGSGLNSYWVMPFREHCTITLENRGKEQKKMHYQVNYLLTDVPNEAAYFHAQFRRVKRTPLRQAYTIVDSIKGKGHFVGTSIAWGNRTKNWWGEGEVKFYIDGDTKFPTINNTGLEDYFGGSYGFLVTNEKGERVLKEYTTPYTGFYEVNNQSDFPDNIRSRFGLYRWHISDPIRFKDDLKVTIQVLGMEHPEDGRKYVTLQEDVASVAYWYQTEPHTPFPDLPNAEDMKIK